MSKSLGTYDYVIVGGGTAGCLLANRLSSDPLVNVLLLEAGGKDNYHWIHIPVGYLYCINNPRTDWCYKTENETGLDGRSIIYARGRVMGGCSSINGMVYMRGQAEDYDNWSDLGNTGWGWREVLPYFRRHEDYFRGPSDTHGVGGEWRVEEQRLNWPILDVVTDAFVETGVPKTDCFNSGNNFGVGYFHVNQRRGFRVNASQAFLKPIRHRKNLQIVTDSQAKEILFEGTKAVGISFDNDGQDCRAFASREVILCTGSIGTPQLLELSGIGQSGRLEEVGIQPRVHLPGVGENLQDHLQVRLAYKVRNALTLNELAGSLFGKARIAAEYLVKRSGPMSMAPSQLGAFAKSDPNRRTPNIQYHFQPLTLDKFGDPLHDFPAITASVCNLRPTSRGSIHISHADYRIAPKIRPNYLSTKADRQVAVDSIRFTRRVMAANALKPYQPEEFRPGESAQSDEDLAYAASSYSSTIFHPVGTARMGHDSMAVVDDRLRVHGFTGLRIADASVMPRITSGNTNAPTLMIAERAAEMIVQDRRSHSLS